MLVARTQQPTASTSAQPYSPPPPPRPPPTPRRASVPQSQPILVNGTLTSTSQLQSSGGRLKKYACTHPGCLKAFTRPVRLQEHQRSHTGERPFQCPQCSSTFARDSHLKAHLRTHASEEDKPLQCDQCEKRFWTNQHLKKHVELVHEGKTYDCTSCSPTFKKHNLLRTHIAEVHSTPGTNPFICDHPGCDKSFKQNVHLKAHVKTHDPSRYLCLHPSCLPLPLQTRQFPTWSSLQKHTKLAHPPTCPYAECNGKVFASNRGLKGHLGLHEDGKVRSRKRRRKGRKSGGEETAEETAEETDRDGEKGVGTSAAAGAAVGGVGRAQDDEEDVSSADEDDEQWQLRQEEERDSRMAYDFARGGKKKRRIQKQRDLAAEEGGDEEEDDDELFGTLSPWVCEVGLRGARKCGRRFKDADALESHQLASHPTLPMVSPSFNSLPPLPPLPALPAATSSSSDEEAEMEEQDDPEPPLAPPGVSLLDLITGANYAPPSALPPTSTSTHPIKRKYPCPFPSILDIAFPLAGPPSPSSAAAKEGEGAHEEEGPCPYWFSRVYDVQRHLRSRHRVEVESGELGEWFEEGSEGESGESGEGGEGSEED